MNWSCQLRWRTFSLLYVHNNIKFNSLAIKIHPLQNRLLWRKYLYTCQSKALGSVTKKIVLFAVASHRFPVAACILLMKKPSGGIGKGGVSSSVTEHSAAST